MTLTWLYFPNPTTTTTITILLYFYSTILIASVYTNVTIVIMKGLNETMLTRLVKVHMFYLHSNKFV